MNALCVLFCVAYCFTVVRGHTGHHQTKSGITAPINSESEQSAGLPEQLYNHALLQSQPVSGGHLQKADTLNYTKSSKHSCKHKHSSSCYRQNEVSDQQPNAIPEFDSPEKYAQPDIESLPTHSIGVGNEVDFHPPDHFQNPGYQLFHNADEYGNIHRNENNANGSLELEASGEDSSEQSGEEFDEDLVDEMTSKWIKHKKHKGKRSSSSSSSSSCSSSSSSSSSSESSSESSSSESSSSESTSSESSDDSYIELNELPPELRNDIKQAIGEFIKKHAHHSKLSKDFSNNQKPDEDKTVYETQSKSFKKNAKEQSKFFSNTADSLALNTDSIYPEQHTPDENEKEIEMLHTDQSSISNENNDAILISHDQESPSKIPIVDLHDDIINPEEFPGQTQLNSVPELPSETIAVPLSSDVDHSEKPNIEQAIPTQVLANIDDHLPIAEEVLPLITETSKIQSDTVALDQHIEEIPSEIVYNPAPGSICDVTDIHSNTPVPESSHNQPSISDVSNNDILLGSDRELPNHIPITDLHNDIIIPIGNADKIQLNSVPELPSETFAVPLSSDVDHLEKPNIEQAIPTQVLANIDDHLPIAEEVLPLITETSKIQSDTVALDQHIEEIPTEIVYNPAPGSICDVTDIHINTPIPESSHNQPSISDVSNNDILLGSDRELPNNIPITDLRNDIIIPIGNADKIQLNSVPELPSETFSVPLSSDVDHLEKPNIEQAIPTQVLANIDDHLPIAEEVLPLITETSKIQSDTVALDQHIEEIPTEIVYNPAPGSICDVTDIHINTPIPESSHNQPSISDVSNNDILLGSDRELPNHIPITDLHNDIIIPIGNADKIQLNSVPELPSETFAVPLSSDVDHLEKPNIEQAIPTQVLANIDDHLPIAEEVLPLIAETSKIQSDTVALDQHIEEIPSEIVYNPAPGSICDVTDIHSNTPVPESSHNQPSISDVSNNDILLGSDRELPNHIPITDLHNDIIIPIGNADKIQLNSVPELPSETFAVPLSSDVDHLEKPNVEQAIPTQVLENIDDHLPIAEEVLPLITETSKIQSDTVALDQHIEEIPTEIVYNPAPGSICDVTDIHINTPIPESSHNQPSISDVSNNDILLGSDRELPNHIPITDLHNDIIIPIGNADKIQLNSVPELPSETFAVPLSSDVDHLEKPNIEQAIPTQVLANIDDHLPIAEEVLPLIAETSKIQSDTVALDQHIEEIPSEIVYNPAPGSICDVTDIHINTPIPESSHNQPSISDVSNNDILLGSDRELPNHIPITDLHNDIIIPIGNADKIQLNSVPELPSETFAVPLSSDVDHLEKPNIEQAIPTQVLANIDDHLPIAEEVLPLIAETSKIQSDTVALDQHIEEIPSEIVYNPAPGSICDVTDIHSNTPVPESSHNQPSISDVSNTDILLGSDRELPNHIPITDLHNDIIIPIGNADKIQLNSVPELPSETFAVPLSSDVDHLEKPNIEQAIPTQVLANIDDHLPIAEEVLPLITETSKIQSDTVALDQHIEEIPTEIVYNPAPGSICDVTDIHINTPIPESSHNQPSISDVSNNDILLGSDRELPNHIPITDLHNDIIIPIGNADKIQLNSVPELPSETFAVPLSSDADHSEKPNIEQAIPTQVLANIDDHLPIAEEVLPLITETSKIQSDTVALDQHIEEIPTEIVYNPAPGSICDVTDIHIKTPIPESSHNQPSISDVSNNDILLGSDRELPNHIPITDLHNDIIIPIGNADKIQLNSVPELPSETFAVPLSSDADHSEKPNIEQAIPTQVLANIDDHLPIAEEVLPLITEISKIQSDTVALDQHIEEIPTEIVYNPAPGSICDVTDIHINTPIPESSHNQPSISDVNNNDIPVDLDQDFLSNIPIADLRHDIVNTEGNVKVSEIALISQDQPDTSENVLVETLSYQPETFRVEQQPFSDEVMNSNRPNEVIPESTVVVHPTNQVKLDDSVSLGNPKAKASRQEISPDTSFTTLMNSQQPVLDSTVITGAVLKDMPLPAIENIVGGELTKLQYEINNPGPDSNELTDKTREMPVPLAVNSDQKYRPYVEMRSVNASSSSREKKRKKQITISVDGNGGSPLTDAMRQPESIKPDSEFGTNLKELQFPTESVLKSLPEVYHNDLKKLSTPDLLLNVDKQQLPTVASSIEVALSPLEDSVVTSTNQLAEMPKPILDSPKSQDQREINKFPYDDDVFSESRPKTVSNKLTVIETEKINSGIEAEENSNEPIEVVSPTEIEIIVQPTNERQPVPVVQEADGLVHNNILSPVVPLDLPRVSDNTDISSVNMPADSINEQIIFPAVEKTSSEALQNPSEYKESFNKVESPLCMEEQIPAPKIPLENYEYPNSDEKKLTEPMTAVQTIPLGDTCALPSVGNDKAYLETTLVDTADSVATELIEEQKSVSFSTPLESFDNLPDNLQTECKPNESAMNAARQEFPSCIVSIPAAPEMLDTKQLNVPLHADDSLPKVATFAFGSPPDERKEFTDNAVVQTESEEKVREALADRLSNLPKLTESEQLTVGKDHEVTVSVISDEKTLSINENIEMASIQSDQPKTGDCLLLGDYVKQPHEEAAEFVDSISIDLPNENTPNESLNKAYASELPYLNGYLEDERLPAPVVSSIGTLRGEGEETIAQSLELLNPNVNRLEHDIDGELYHELKAMVKKYKKFYETKHAESEETSSSLSSLLSSSEELDEAWFGDSSSPLSSSEEFAEYFYNEQPLLGASESKCDLDHAQEKLLPNPIHLPSCLASLYKERHPNSEETVEEEEEENEEGKIRSAGDESEKSTDTDKKSGEEDYGTLEKYVDVEHCSLDEDILERIEEAIEQAEESIEEKWRKEFPKNIATELDKDDDRIWKYDVLAIGSGPAVLSSLKVFIEAGKSVLIVESGGYPSPKSASLHYRPSLLSSDYVVAVPASAPKCEHPKTIFTAQVLGSLTSYNSNLWDKGSKLNYRKWSEVSSKWSWKNVSEYYRSIESREEIKETVTQKTIVEVRNPNDDTVTYSTNVIETTVTRTIERAFVEKGLSTGRFELSTVDKKPGFALVPVISEHKKTVLLAQKMLQYAKGKPNINLCLNTQTYRIIMDRHGKTVEAVEVVTASGKLRRIEAAESVLLGTDPINTAKILTQSGMASRKSLERLNIPPVLELPYLGQDFIVRPMFLGLCVAFEKFTLLPQWDTDFLAMEYLFAEQKMSPGVALNFYKGFLKIGAAGVDRYTDEANVQVNFFAFSASMSVKLEGYVKGLFHFDLEIADYIIELCQKYDLLFFGPQLMNPKSRGSIGIRKTSDGTLVPDVDTAMYKEEQDMKVMKKTVRIVESLSQASVFQELGGQLIEIPVRHCNRRDRQCRIRHLSVCNLHYTGGAIMGAGKRTSVVSEDLRVHGTKNLYCFNSAVIPHGLATDSVACDTMLGNYGAHMILSKSVDEEEQGENDVI